MSFEFFVIPFVETCEVSLNCKAVLDKLIKNYLFHFVMFISTAR